MKQNFVPPSTVDHQLNSNKNNDLHNNHTRLITDDEWDPVALWAEIHRLRAEVRGPDGVDSWKDVATAERVRRIEAEHKMKEQVDYWKKRTQLIEEQMVRVKEAFACDQAGVLRPLDPIGYFHMKNGAVSATQLTKKLMECMTGENCRIPLYALPPKELVKLTNEIEQLKNVEGIKDWKMVPVGANTR